MVVHRPVFVCSLYAYGAAALLRRGNFKSVLDWTSFSLPPLD